MNYPDTISISDLFEETDCCFCGDTGYMPVDDPADAPITTIKCPECYRGKIVGYATPGHMEVLEVFPKTGRAVFKAFRTARHTVGLVRLSAYQELEQKLKAALEKVEDLQGDVDRANETD